MFKRKIYKRRAAPSAPLSSRIPRPSSKKALFLWGGIIFSSLLIGGLISFSIFFFRIDTIDIQTNEGNPNLQYSKLQLMMESVKQENLLLLSSSFLKKQLFISFPELKDITITKKLPRTIILKPSIDPIIFKWIYKTTKDPDHKFFGYISEKGFYFKHGPDEIFTVFEDDIRDDYIASISKILSIQEIKNIQQARARLQEVIKRPIPTMHYLRKAQEIHFLDDKGVQYWIFLKEDSIKQIEKLKTAIDQRNIFKNKLEYIDLRIGRKVIYKPK